MSNTANKVATERYMGYNTAPTGFDSARDLVPGFVDFLLPLHREFTPRQQQFIAQRAENLSAAHQGRRPNYLPQSEAITSIWRITVPDWCADQRNQMTGPADDAELVVKMLNSGAPGVMLDLEDSMANQWSNLTQGIANILAALAGTLTYLDVKRGRTVSINQSSTVILLRARGLHLNQAGVLADELLSASLFDVASIAYAVDPAKLKHPLTFYLPKSESAQEALWWRDVFQAVALALGWEPRYIKCMALVESHPLAYQMEEFLYNLREHILGLNLGRWDYMASLIHFNLDDPEWVLPDRNTIPHDVPFFQNLRERMVDVCHRHGALAIGGMTALYPSRTDCELNERALKVLAADKKNEADCGMDGAWTGHPDQNEIALRQFPAPNQLLPRRPTAARQPDLRPVVPRGVGHLTVAGTRAAVRTVIRYRQGVLSGNGASLLDGYMEDLATDRIYRLMIAQRIRHRQQVKIVDDEGKPIEHTVELITGIFDTELGKLIDELPPVAGPEVAESFCEARALSEGMIMTDEYDPV